MTAGAVGAVTLVLIGTSESPSSSTSAMAQPETVAAERNLCLGWVSRIDQVHGRVRAPGPPKDQAVAY
jgi:hypothetical protein